MRILLKPGYKYTQEELDDIDECNKKLKSIDNKGVAVACTLFGLAMIFLAYMVPYIIDDLINGVC